MLTTMWDLLRRLHTALRAHFVRHYRIRETVKAFEIAHAQELKAVPVQMWPLTMARQKQELDAVRSGNLPLNLQGQDIVDRKSWSWPFLPVSVTRMSMPILKATPYNLRRMSRTPVPRRAINLIKGALISQPWEVCPIKDVEFEDEEDQKRRIAIGRKIFTHPNGQDSWQSWLEQSIEDQLLLGAFATELRYTPDGERPLKMWPVMIESVRLMLAWSESTPDMPRFVQMTGLKGERGAVVFYDDEMLYCKDNVSTDNPFGLGAMEVAFLAVNDFLGVQYMAGRAGSDAIHKTWLWWEQPQSEAAYQIVRRHIQNELEGQAKVSIIGGMKKPEVVEIQPTNEADLLLNWQEMLIRMIANAFDLSAMALGIEHDVNRAVGEVLDDRDHRSAVVPRGRRIEAALTRKILHEKLGWYDLEFKFLSLEDPDIVSKMDLLARQYSANAVTPNEIRKAMGRDPLDTPFADLTQFEAMLVNAEAVARLKQRAAKAAGPSPFGAPGGGTGLPETRTGQPSMPGKMSLPKFPIAGTRFTARELASMEPEELQELMDTGQVPEAPNLIRDMEDQEPGILEEMTEELREFLEERAKAGRGRKSSKSPKRAGDAEQGRKYREQEKRTADFGTWLQRNAGKAAARWPRSNRPGQAGNVNPKPLSGPVRK